MSADQSIDVKIIEIIKGNDVKYEKLAQILKLVVNTCDIDQKKYFLLGSYAIRKEREINYLDINIDHNEFFKLEKVTKLKGLTVMNEIGHLEFYNGQIRWFFDMTDLYNKYSGEVANDFSIEMFQKDPLIGFPNEKFSLSYLTDTNGLDVDNYGHQFFSYSTLLSWKETMARPKDVADIVLLKELINKEQEQEKQKQKQQGGGYYAKYMKYKTKYNNLLRRL
jgi:hypothetical protein